MYNTNAGGAGRGRRGPTLMRVQCGQCGQVAIEPVERPGMTAQGVAHFTAPCSKADCTGVMRAIAQEIPGAE